MNEGERKRWREEEEQGSGERGCTRRVGNSTTYVCVAAAQRERNLNFIFIYLVLCCL